MEEKQNLQTTWIIKPVIDLVMEVMRSCSLNLADVYYNLSFTMSFHQVVLLLHV